MLPSALAKEFVERKIYPLPSIPETWDLEKGNYYLLDLKMCQIRSLQYNFKWGQSLYAAENAPITEQNFRIVKVDLSLNDITVLEHKSLWCFPEMRALDASLNRIQKVVGLEVLEKLRWLNLSHNGITQLEGLQNCHNLVELNLSANSLEEISLMPSLSNIKVLHLSNNNLKSLDGVQALRQLKELFVQRNMITDLVPLSASVGLSVLNAADNKISSLEKTCDVLSGLVKMQVLTLYGNQIETERNYKEELLKNTKVHILDSISVKAQARALRVPTNEHISSVQDLAKQAFKDQLNLHREKMLDTVSFLQKRIIDVQLDFDEYEKKMNTDLEGCLRYLDGLTLDEIQGYDVTKRLGSPLSKPWQEYLPNNRTKNKKKSEYKDIKDTDQVLKNASNELSKEVPYNQVDWT